MNWGKYFKFVVSLFLLLAIPAGVILVQSAIKYFSKASGTPANLVIDMSTDYGKGVDAWRNLAQGGEERGRMLAPVITQVAALRPEYIRIDHVFDYYSNEQELDAVIGDITKTGAKPFIALSYMPPSIAKGGDINSEPNNWADWENLVQKTIEHISGKNGLAISGVYYEVWNEPDLFGKFTISGSKNYLDLYLHTALGAGRAANTLPFKFGGPATTGYHDNWMSSLVGFASANNLRLDYLSWHAYSKNLDDFDAQIGQARRFGKELVMSEMGPNGANDSTYDNYFGAIHEIAVSTAMFHASVGKTFTFEIIDGPGEKKFWGRWGLYTNPKFGAPEAKPRAQAISFLNSMIGGSTLQVIGEGSWVRGMAKKISDKLTRILIVNYDPVGTHEEFVPVTFINLPSQNFTLKRIEFFGSSFSQDIATASAEWATAQYLKPNSAMIFEVTTK